MSAHRSSVNEKAFYTSFEELRAAWGLNPLTKKTSDEKKLNSQREKFSNRHLCRNCKQPMVYSTGNIMVCKNEKCMGEKHERLNEITGETKIYYTPSFDLLDEKGANIASNIFE